MDKSNHIVVLITAKDAAEGHDIADALLDQRLAACVSIAADIDSHYWWRGKVEAAEESLLIVKSREVLLPKIIEAVKKIHGYEVPEIIALPVVGGDKDYLAWIDGEATGGK
jgi:periplasmic divalent cation tolerance protein